MIPVLQRPIKSHDTGATQTDKNHMIPVLHRPIKSRNTGATETNKGH